MKPALQIFFRRNGLTALLSLCALASLAVIGYETEWGHSLRSTATASTGARKAEMVATLPAFTLTPLETGYRESGERPLFLPTRRPVLAVAVSQVVMKKGQFKLTGTSVAPDMSVAYMQEVSSGKTIRVTKGQEINGIKLEIVESARVVLKQGDDSEELTLRTAASPPKPPPAAPPGAVVAGQSGSVPATSGPAAAFMPGGAPVAQTPLPAGSAATTPPAAPQQMAISILRSAAPVAAPNANEAPADSNPAAQRRRRFQNAPQQLPDNKIEK